MYIRHVFRCGSLKTDKTDLRFASQSHPQILRRRNVGLSSGYRYGESVGELNGELHKITWNFMLWRHLTSPLELPDKKPCWSIETIAWFISNQN